MNAKTPDPDQGSEVDDCFCGDPGVGALMADPLAPSERHERPDPSKGPASPDPAQLRHHGEWMPTRKNDDRPRR